MSFDRDDDYGVCILNRMYFIQDVLQIFNCIEKRDLTSTQTAASSKGISSQDFWNFEVELLVSFNLLLYSISSKGCGLVTARDLGTDYLW